MNPQITDVLLAVSVGNVAQKLVVTMVSYQSLFYCFVVCSEEKEAPENDFAGAKATDSLNIFPGNC